MQFDDLEFESGVNLSELLARVEGDHELMCELFAIFRSEFPKLHLELKDAVMRADLEQVAISAHTLKGMLASLSFNKATASARCIEQMASQSPSEEIAEELSRLERHIAIAYARLALICKVVN